MQKRKKIPALLLTLLLMLVLAPAAYADTDANTPQITQQQGRDLFSFLHSHFPPISV